VLACEVLLEEVGKLLALHIIESQINIIGVLIHELVAYPAACYTHNGLELMHAPTLQNHIKDLLLERRDNDLVILLHTVSEQRAKHNINHPTVFATVKNI
jgi:hypothetical protein